MDLPRLKLLAARIVLTSMPTLSGCSVFGTYVVPLPPGESCERACSALIAGPDADGYYHSSVNACTTGSLVEGGQEREVAVCRMVSSGPAGRRPPGLRPVRGEVGGWFREAARLEAASVPAFEHLARELRAHCAPDSLVADALAARDDEARHARVMDGWRRRVGGAALELSVDASPIRSLEAMAVDNAIEGCAGESVGALFAAHQGLAAQDPALREDMAAIALDELAHAHLSMRIEAWALDKLSCGARRRVHAAREAAFDALSAAPSPDARALSLLGLPDHAARQHLVASARASFFG